MGEIGLVQALTMLQRSDTAAAPRGTSRG